MHGLRLFVAGEQLTAFICFINRAGRKISVEDSQYLTGCLLEHNRAYGDAGGSFVPKHHQCLHIARDSSYHGNPQFYTTYEDESANRTGKLIGQMCHPVRFAMSWWERNLVLELLPSVGVHTGSSSRA